MNTKRTVLYIIGFLAIILAPIHGAEASGIDAEVEAKRLLERLAATKVPADHPLIPKMKSEIEKGRWYPAADLAMTHPGFLNVTVKQMALKMSTREETIQQDFNDFAAFFVGLVRDDLDARQLLTGNFQYIGDASRAPAGVTIRSEYDTHIVRSNDHFRDMDRLNIDLSRMLVKKSGQMLLQTQTNSLIYNPDPAGVLTSRTFMMSQAAAGTNRRPVEYTFREFMCAPIETWADTSASDARIGRDIDRHPGGDHTKFQVSCKGCHTGMDGFRGAFAKWDIGNGFILNRDIQVNAQGVPQGGVSNKLNANSNVFAAGFVTTDNSFVNNAMGSANYTKFGWRSNSTSGYGVKDFAGMVANSKRFSECMVKRVFESVCRRELSIEDNLNFVKEHALKFEEKGYNIKSLYALVSVTPECVE